jgi:hypothetical protein
VTDIELAQLAALANCRFSPGSSAKSFVRRLSAILAQPQSVIDVRELSDKESRFLDSLAHQYRKQVGKCLAADCEVCHLATRIDRDVIRVALDAFIENRAVDDFEPLLPAWRKAALRLYNKSHGTKLAHPYEYATHVKRRRANTRGDIYCRFCGERLFAQVKQPHQLVRESGDAQRHLTICALMTLAEMRTPAKPGHRTVPMEDLWRDDGPLFATGRAS